MNKPYVISAELDLPGTGLDVLLNTAQIDAFREDLDGELRRYGKATEWVPSSVLADGLAVRLAAARRPIVSLDGRYIKNVRYLHGHFASR